MAQVIVALDMPSAAEALELVDRLGDRGDFYKVGLELYTRAGPDLVAQLVSRDKRVFLDLKLHDIPNTVAGAVRAASELGVDLLTVHGSGGRAMLEAAAGSVVGDLRLLGVTVLTSLTSSEISEVWGRRIESVGDEVARLVELAQQTGMHGVVASPLEASSIRVRVGGQFLIVTPGIRPAGADRGDQTRVATPADATRAGADYLVVGRVVTRAADPLAALAAVQVEVRAAAEENDLNALTG